MNKDDHLAFLQFKKTIDSGNFSAATTSKHVAKPWGYEIHFTPKSLPYVGKILHIDQDKRISLQAHETKTESWYLASGNINLILEDDAGNLTREPMQPNRGYTCLPGEIHRLIGGSGGGEVFEVSSPEQGRTFRLEDDYNRSTENTSNK